MIGGTEDKNPSTHATHARRSSNLLFHVFLVIAIILPPLGIALGLVILTASDDEPYSKNRSTRGKTLIALGIFTLVLQVTLASVFLVPKAFKYLDEQWDASGFLSNPLSSINPSGYRVPQLPESARILRAVLNSHSNQDFVRSKYEEAKASIAAGSMEPLDRYIVAGALLYTEFTDEIIEDDDERHDEAARLILEGLNLDGENIEEEEILDVMMLTPLMHTQFNDDNIEGAYETYDRLLAADVSKVGAYVIITTRKWAYNSLFEYWQIRDPHKSLDFALTAIRGTPWHGSEPPLGNYMYEYRGGLENVFLLANRLGRTDEFFGLLEFFIDSAEQRLTLESDLAQLFLVMGRYLGRDGRWTDAEHYLSRGVEILPDAPEYIYSHAVALFESGAKTEAADIVFNATLGKKPLLSLDDIRYLFADHPAEGVEYLTRRLIDNPHSIDHYKNLAIMAHRAGDDETARISLELISIVESGEFEPLTTEAAMSLSGGDIKSAKRTLAGITIDESPSAVSSYVEAFIYSPSAPANQAAELTRAALERGPYERDTDVHLFDTYFSSMQALGKTDEAFTFLWILTDDNPNELYPRQVLARELLEEGRLNEALLIFDDMQSLFAVPGQMWVQEQSSELFYQSRDRVIALNDVQIQDIFREKALIYREWDDIEKYDHYIFLTSVYGFGFESDLVVAERRLEKGELKDAGEILDNLSFYPEVDDTDSHEFHALISLYAKLESAGWVRERNFEPFSNSTKTHSQ